MWLDGAAHRGSGERTVLTSTAKAWRLMSHDPVAIARVGEALQVPPIVAQLLLNRGVAEADAPAFLHAPFKSLRDPDLLPGVPEAADRLYAAVRQSKRICVYG